VPEGSQRRQLHGGGLFIVQMLRGVSAEGRSDHSFCLVNWWQSQSFH